MNPETLTKQRHIGLLFGSFNPVHNGHIELAQAALDAQLVDEVWFVVSPHNPHKGFETLVSFEHRVGMVRIATQQFPSIKVSEIEETLPLPSYTYNTLRVLRAEYPDTSFSIISGADVIESIMTWKEPDEIVAHHDFLVRERSHDHVMNVPNGVRVHIIPGTYEISSTTIREQLHDQKNPELISPEVLRYIHDHQLYC